MEYIYKNTKKCKYCGADIAKNAKRCPNCGGKQKNSVAVVIIGILLTIIGISLFMNSLQNFSTADSDNQLRQPLSSAGTAVQVPSVAPDSMPEPKEENDATISADEFNAISTGMTYAEVVEIVGADGELTSEVDLGMGSEYKTALYTWKGNSLGANANVTFQGGKVIAKAQIGLK